MRAFRTGGAPQNWIYGTDHWLPCRVRQNKARYMAKPKLTAVTPLSYLAASAIEAPGMPPGLGEAGQQLWQSVQSQYRVDDAGGVELLKQACLASDRVARLKKLIDADGERVKSADGSYRSNPLLRDEVALRALIARLLVQLGLNHEPKQHGPGRPAARPGAV